MTTPVEQFLTTRFLNLYGSPETIDPKGFIKEYERALGGYEPLLLRECGNRVIDANEYKVWPTVGACKAMLRRICEERETDKLRKQHHAEAPMRHRVVSEESKARVDELLAQFKNNMRAKFQEDRERNRGPILRTDRDAWETRFGARPDQVRTRDVVTDEYREEDNHRE